MVITAGPITLARPGWGLKRGTVTSFVASGSDGRPEVLAAQVLCSAAVSGAKVLMLLPNQRCDDDVVHVMMDILAAGDRKAASQTLRELTLTIHTCGLGWEKVGRADLVYAPGLSVRDLRRLDPAATPPMLVVGRDFDGRSACVPGNVVRVGGDILVVDNERFEVPVVYDGSGPIYRPA
jgi:hypothetical protein